MTHKLMKFFHVLFVVLCFYTILNENTFGSLTTTWPNDDVIVSDQKPFIKAIDKAKNYIILGTYKIQDHILPDNDFINALRNAIARKVKIYLMIEKNLTDPEKKEGNKGVKSGDSLKIYQDLGIELIACPERFEASHLKVLVADDLYSIIGTTNFDKKFDSREDGITRDFSVKITYPDIISELKNVLLKDIENKVADLPDYKVKDMIGFYKLTWGPEQHRLHFLEIIDGAKESINIYQQALQDTEIVHHLVDALKRGVKVKILMSKYPFGKKHGNPSEPFQQEIREAGGEVKLTSAPPLHIHGKLIIVDYAMAAVGSCNFFTPSMNKDRQLTLLTKKPEHIAHFSEVFEKDWKATP